MKAPVLTTDRLILRSFEAGDVEPFAEVMSNKEAMWDLYSIEGVPQDPIGFATWLIDDALSSWAKSGFGNWAICTNSSDLGPHQRVIGFAGFTSEEHLSLPSQEALEVGYTIRPEFGGNGLATEASVAVIEYGFDVLRTNKIVAVTSPNNMSSRRMMERLGMEYSKNISAYGSDCVLYAVTKEHWKS